MKKFLLTTAAAIACFAMAAAQNYTATAYAAIDEEWGDVYDDMVAPDECTVECYDSYVIIRAYMGTPGEDLKVAFDADENVTSLTPINDGVEGKAVTDGYTDFYVTNPDYYYAQFYLAEGFDYAYCDEEGGYVYLSGYFYENNDEFVWGYYSIEWENEAEANLILETTTHTAHYADWDEDDDEGPFMTDGTIGVEVYDNNHIILRGWAGVEGYDLIVKFDDDANIEAMVAVELGEALEAVENGWISTYTGDETYYYATIYLEEEYCYAYSNESEGYVLLSAYWYTDEENYEWKYYFVEWGVDGVTVTEVDNEGMPVYYNMQGMRVDNPVAGQLYIKQQGKTATKVIIR